MKVGLIIGHKPNKPGACNQTHGMCEYQFNDLLACDIEDYIKENDPNIDVIIIRRRTYKSLPSDVNKIAPDFCISLHCNALNGKINGTEVLYYHRSKKGKMIAEILQKKLVETLEFRDLGVKPKTAEDRGGFLLRYTNMPCVIAEPFFIDVDDAFVKVMQKQLILVQAYSKAIRAIAKRI